MKVYFGHSCGLDYEQEYYQPIRNDESLAKYNIILPHEQGSTNSNTRDFYRDIDLFIADVTYPATGLGIELGWAKDDGVPIVCIYRSGSKISGSLYAVTDKFYEYEDHSQFVKVIQDILESNEKATQK